jgi:AraC-like DNA-binding protein
MVDHGHVILLLANSKAPLHTLLSQGLGHVATVLFWGSAVQRLSVKTCAVAVVDLLDGGPPLQPCALLPLASGATVWLVAGPRPVASDWLDLAHESGVHVAQCPPERPTEGVERVVAAIERALRGPTVEQLAARVLEREPRFLGAAELLTPILEHAWEIRHPSQLALRTGQSLSRLRETCRTLGFRRAEHFIVAVRLVAAEDLMARDRMRPCAARHLVGIADLSNFRRQLRRAQHGSPCGTLASPVS